jgi:broad specificity phosphatase PhoE
MKVYFVRHGETVENSKEVYQDAFTNLSPQGKRQAEILANRIKKINIDLIITSTFLRTKQTTEIINKKNNKPVIKSELFVERKRPTQVEGLSYKDPTALKIKNYINSNFHIESFRHSDEEIFTEMKGRAIKALDFVTKQNAENILVVSHGDFLLCIFGVVLFGNKFKAKEYLNFKDKLYSENTGITLCEFKDNNWKAVTWNDHAHL